jgi:hypothetical protein
VAGLIAVFAIYNNMAVNQNADQFSQIEPAAGIEESSESLIGRQTPMPEKEMNFFERILNDTSAKEQTPPFPNEIKNTTE